MSNTTTALIATGDIEQILASIKASPEAIENKNKIVELAKSVTDITDQASFDASTTVAENVKGYLTDIEKKAKAKRDPFTAANKKIIKVEEELSDDPAKHLKRINDLRAAFLKKLADAAQEKARKLAEEQAAIAREQLRIEQEKARIAKAEADAKLAAEQAKTKKAREEAAAALKKIEDDKLDQEFAEAAIAERTETAAAVVIEKPLEGSGARKDFEIELTDAALFFLNFPEYCSVEIKKNPFKEFLKVHWTEKSNFPGVKVTPKFSAPVKGTNPSLLLNS